MKNHKTVFFDVCGTITKTNNTFDFIGFVLKRDNAPKYFAFRAVVLAVTIARILRIHRLFKEDIARKMAIKLLKGYSVERVGARAKEYSDILERKGLFRKEIITIVKNLKADGARIILLSASIDPPIREIAKRLEIEEWYSSELAVDRGLYTGEMSKDLLANKETVLYLIKDFKKEDSAYYTDNEEDFGLKNDFGEFIPVPKDRIDKTRYGVDVGSINESNYAFSYIPSLYYTLSRFHARGTIELIFKDIIPVFLIVWFFGRLDPLKSAVLTFASFFMFYSIYEIGGLYNDLNVKNEKGHNPIYRIKENVRINVLAFIGIRVFLFLAFIIYLCYLRFPCILFAISTFACLCVYVIHTRTMNNFRVFTYACLRTLRIASPLILFYKITPIFPVFVVFFIVNFPKRLYEYIMKREGGNNIFKDPLYSILYYFSVILIGVMIYLLTSCDAYLFVPGYLFFIDSVSFIIWKYHSENSHIW